MAFTPAAPASQKLQPRGARITRGETGAVVRVEHAASAEQALDEEWHGLENDGAAAAAAAARRASASASGSKDLWLDMAAISRRWPGIAS